MGEGDIDPSRGEREGVGDVSNKREGKGRGESEARQYVTMETRETGGGKSDGVEGEEKRAKTAELGGKDNQGKEDSGDEAE